MLSKASSIKEGCYAWQWFLTMLTYEGHLLSPETMRINETPLKTAIKSQTMLTSISKQNLVKIYHVVQEL